MCGTKDELRGPLPWYKALIGGADPTEEQPGQICVVGSATDNFLLEIFGVIEFKVAISTSNSPMELRVLEQLRKARADQTQARERDRLLKVLAPSTGK